MKFIPHDLDALSPAPEVGVTLSNEDDVLTLRPEVHRLDLITLHFPKWTDGRAYSQARLLRSRLRYTGALRATGDVRVDMLPLLRRTGFDEVQLAPGESPEVARRVLQLQPAPYQAYDQAFEQALERAA